MTPLFKKLIIAAALVCALLLFYASSTKSSLVLLPSDLLASDREIIKRVRLAGKVADAPILYTVTPKFELKFSISNPGESKNLGGAIPVVYNDIKPEMFAVGRDVILEGQYNQGVFYATKLMTQCPSKYEPPKPGEVKPGERKLGEKYSKES